MSARRYASGLCWGKGSARGRAIGNQGACMCMRVRLHNERGPALARRRWHAQACCPYKPYRPCRLARLHRPCPNSLTLTVDTVSWCSPFLRTQCKLLLAHLTSVSSRCSCVAWKDAWACCCKACTARWQPACRVLMPVNLRRCQRVTWRAPVAVCRRPFTAPLLLS